MRRPKSVTAGFPRASAQITSASSAKVVTLMPPAVLALPAPTNMRMSVTSQVVSRIDP
jgi:hypothetical protein